MLTRWILILVAAALVTVLALLPNARTDATSQNPPTPAVDIRIALAEIGVTPEAIAASGLHATAANMFNTLSSASEQVGLLRTLRESLSPATASETALASSLSLQPGNEGLMSQYQAAQASVETLRGQITQAQQTLFEMATDGLSSNQAEKLTTFKQNQGRSVPPEFRVKARTDAQWQALERALIAERRAIRLNQTLDQQTASLLTETRSDPDVAAAASDLQSHLAGIQALIPTTSG